MNTISEFIARTHNLSFISDYNYPSGICKSFPEKMNYIYDYCGSELPRINADYSDCIKILLKRGVLTEEKAKEYNEIWDRFEIFYLSPIFRISYRLYNDIITYENLKSK